MGRRRFFIRKDTKKTGRTKEWIEMEGDDFYRFLRTEEAKGRYFIQLANDGDPDCDVIHMEVSKPEYLAWRADFDRKQYYRKRNHRHGFILVSLSDPSGDMKEKGLTIEDVTGSGTPGTWERAVEEMEVEELQQAISKLSQGDRELLKMRFWDSMTQQEELLEMYYWESMKLQEIGRELGTTPQNIYQRLRRVRRKLRRIM